MIFRKKKPALNIKEGIFYKDIEGYTIRVNKKDDDGILLKGILIYDHTSGEGNNKVLIAESGKMELTADEKFLELTLYNGHSYIDIEQKKRKDYFRTTNFKKNLIRFDLSSFNSMNNSEKLYKGHYAMLNNKQLSIAIDSLQIKYEEKEKLLKQNINSKYLSNLKKENENTYINIDKTEKKQQFDIASNKIRTLLSILKSNKDDLKYRKIILTKHKIEWHRKITLAVACLLLFLIGAPLGSIIRKGGLGIPVLVSVVFFIFYHVLNMIGEKAAKELSIEAYQGMWLANVIFFPIAIIIIYKAKNDSKIFNFSNFNMTFNFFKK